MRIFDEPTEDFTCPICGTSEKKPVTLITICGTRQGNIAEAKQYHIDCIELTEYRSDEHVILAQHITKIGEENG